MNLICGQFSMRTQTSRWHPLMGPRSASPTLLNNVTETQRLLRALESFHDRVSVFQAYVESDMHQADFVVQFRPTDVIFLENVTRLAFLTEISRYGSQECRERSTVYGQAKGTNKKQQQLPPLELTLRTTMNYAVLLTILLLAAATAQNSNTFYEASTRDDNKYYFVGFGPYLYTFALPSLDLVNTIFQAGKTFSAPASFDGRFANYGDGTSGTNGFPTGSYKEDTFNNFALTYLPNTPPPADPDVFAAPTTVTDAAGNSYTFNSGDATTKATVTKTSPSGTLLATATLASPHLANGQYSTLLRAFSLQGSTLYLVAAQGAGRGTFDYDYYSFAASDLTILEGPVSLPNSYLSGCPVAPRGCGVAVVEKLTVINGLVVYTYSNATFNGVGPGPFQIYVVSYSAQCGFSTNMFDDMYKRPNEFGSGRCSGGSVSTSEEETTVEEVETTCEEKPWTREDKPTTHQEETTEENGDSNPPLAQTSNGANGNVANTVTQDRSQQGAAAAVVASMVVVAAALVLA
ncbi:hypothetical protein PROFUN_12677 [Planoprotostelium fungivorum]|uniref:Uncharacterized protein n=1 Tax=Planoprotostelium fungivorum TaxID=1890364 RepID=A0A2P6N725_9EUKA|nr:hypothetical protein PROFUN_12677 [Planoprotostelium fungivorum]